MQTATRRRLWFWIPPLALVAVALVWLFRPQPVAGRSRRRSSAEPLYVTVSDEGETRVKDVFVVSAPVPGLMRRIELEVGDPVVADETVVARIEPIDPAFLDRRIVGRGDRGPACGRGGACSRCGRGAACAGRAGFARAELQRFEGLVARSAISQNDLDSARRRARTADAALQESRAGLVVAESELEQARARLVAPGSGRRATGGLRLRAGALARQRPGTARVERERGSLGSGAPLIEVGDPQRLEVVVDLLSTEAVQVAGGTEGAHRRLGRCCAAGGGRAARRTVRLHQGVGARHRGATRQRDHRVHGSRGNNGLRLGHGFRVEPRIVLWAAGDVLKVPLSALYRSDKDWMVFLDDDGRATPTRVRIGHENGLEAEVLAGLRPGQRVVTHPSDRVSAGARIRPR